LPQRPGSSESSAQPNGWQPHQLLACAQVWAICKEIEVIHVVKDCLESKVVSTVKITGLVVFEKRIGDTLAIAKRFQ